MSTQQPAGPVSPLGSRRPAAYDDQVMPEWAVDAVRMIRSPVFLGVIFTSAMVAAGVIVLMVSGWGIHNQYFVALQLPYFVSGGFAGLGLMMTGVCLASILGTRRDQAAEDEEMAGLLDDVTRLARAGIRRHLSDAGA